MAFRQKMKFWDLYTKVCSSFETGELTEIGNFQILSNNDREVERFIDTQIKYGEIYEYRIHRVVLVYGNKYCYLDNIQLKKQNIMCRMMHRDQLPFTYHLV